MESSGTPTKVRHWGTPRQPCAFSPPFSQRAVPAASCSGYTLTARLFQALAVCLQAAQITLQLLQMASYFAGGHFALAAHHFAFAGKGRDALQKTHSRNLLRRIEPPAEP